MKTSDIKIGSTYGFTRYGTPSFFHSTLEPLTVTGIVKENVRNRTSYGTRAATLIVGTRTAVDGEVVEIKVEPRKILAPWSEVEAARQQQADHTNKAAQERLARFNVLDPQIARLEKLLRASGHPTRRQYLGAYALNTVTGEALPERPYEDNGMSYAPGWEYETAEVEAVLDRNEILKNGSVTLKVATILHLIDVAKEG